ncbi:MAG TPA: AarF/UbiB family protein [Mycobacteriales bacterium]|nr:AarF/UbiB family protein [Mycobacteriales bacterium]
MAISVRPQHLKRYKDMSVLLLKYGRGDLVRDAGLDGMADERGAVADGKPEELAADLERLGPTYIKLGQLLSTRGDLLPAPYVDALARLQDNVEPFGFDEVERIVTAEIGARISRAFREFDNIPLASASLGQVHRAVLRDGRAVAVKVQRPGIRDGILDDLDALRELAEFADSHSRTARRYGFAGMLEEFRKSMLRELDYEQEARNLQTLGENLTRFSRIHVPQPVLDYTTTRVLTMDFVGGSKLTSLGPLAQLEVDGSVLADQLLAAYLQQILVDGFFHADPHPGNVFLDENGDIALLDLGMIGRVPNEMQEQLVKMLLGISDGRGEDCARALLTLATPGLDDEEVDEATFRRTVSEIVAEHQRISLSEVRAGAVVLELSRATVQSGLRPPPELSMLGRALLALDEVARTLDPRFDPNDTIRREAADIMRGRMTGSASQGNVFATMLEAKEFVERFPARVNRVMDALAEGELKLNVRGIDEREIMRGLHQLGNRITAGVVIAALIMGAAMLMRVPTRTTILGYPAIAIVCFLAAAGFGFFLLASIWLNDRREAKRPRRRR